ARLVECERARRASARGGHTWRAVPAHDRNLLRPRAARAHRPEGHAESTATGAECPGVQRHNRVPFATAGSAERHLWCTRTDRALGRLPRGVPAAIARCAGAPDVSSTIRLSFAGILREILSSTMCTGRRYLLCFHRRDPFLHLRFCGQ